MKAPTLEELLGDDELLNELGKTIRLGPGAEVNGKYYHWDTLYHLAVPPHLRNHREWWLGIKFARSQLLKALPLFDKDGDPFRYALSDSVHRQVHEIDRSASGEIKISEEVTSAGTRDRYIVNSLINEAITSSQLEGAATTRERAKEMIRTGRRPLDRSEQMILNNYLAMQHIRKLVGSALTPALVLELQDILTCDTLDDSSAAGRFRRADEEVVVEDHEGNVVHIPPSADELPERLQRLCAFANDTAGEPFVHPVVRAIVLHFMLGYDHPFVDGNGRTARALFYWSMLSQGYWLCEYISISAILRAAPSKYSRSYLYTETDENDVTYFISYQLDVVLRAIAELHEYLGRKVEEVREVEQLLRASADFNHRQLALLSHSLKHPNARYSIASHQNSHRVAYQTARTDLLSLAEGGLLTKRRIGRTYYFSPPADLSKRLQRLSA